MTFPSKEHCMKERTVDLIIKVATVVFHWLIGILRDKRKGDKDDDDK